MAKIIVTGTDITVIRIEDADYISITDMARANDGEFFVSNWLRNRNTLEYIEIWEQLNNPTFNYVEFDIIKSQAGLDRFRVSAKMSIEYGEFKRSFHKRRSSSKRETNQTQPNCHTTNASFGGS
jgi:hypothetical protein